MYIRLLGPVGVSDGGDQVIPVSGQVGAAVLAHLALADGRWLSSDALIASVWDDPPASSRNAIQVAVSRLRKQFGPGLVRSGQRGYAVDRTTVRVDWQEAEALVAASRDHLEADDAVPAAETSRSAIELFRGEPLLGLTSVAVDTARRRADDLLHTARLLLTRALLQQGRPDRAVEVVGPLCEADPLDEPAHVLRMEALRASGRQAAALASYHDLRTALADQLGVDPSPAAQAGFARLLRSEAAAETADRVVADRPELPEASPIRPRHALGLAPSRATAYQSRAVGGSLPAAGTAVLTGSSGTGKTQIAAGVFADSTRDLQVWISAGSAESIVAAYADAADVVKRVDSSRPAVERARLFLEWLAATDASWMVVLDDIEDPADLRGWWPPTGRGGLVLATTLRRNAELSGEGRRVLDVGRYSDDEAEAYLRERLGPLVVDSRDGAPLRALATELGHHPLALGLASAVILDEAMTIEQYQELLATTPLSTSLPSDVRADGYPRSLEAACSLALERADRQTDGAAGRLLEVLAVLDPVGVPGSVLDTVAVQQHLDAAVRRGSGTAARTQAVVRSLHRVSLTDHQPASEPRAIQTHALTGRLARERSTGPDLLTALRVAADALVEAWPEFPSARLAEALRSNAAAVEHLDAARGHAALWPPDRAELPALSALHGRSLTDAELFGVAVPYLNEQCLRCTAQLGALHVDTISLRNDIARARGLSGDAEAAREELRQLAAELEREVGSDHPGTLITVATMAGLAVETGSPLVVIEELESTVPRLVDVLGADHDATLTALEALANAHGETGDWARALSMYDDTIRRWQGRIGDEHRRTLILQADRANWLGHSGEAAAARAALEALIPTMQRVMGPHDPNTLRARNNRAYFLTDHQEARREFLQLLDVRLEVLGPDHSDTLATRGNLANRLGMLGDAAGAARDFVDIVEDQTRALGPENRFTLLCRGYLARWLMVAGDERRGRSTGLAALDDLRRVLGRDHPYSLRIEGYLAAALR